MSQGWEEFLNSMDQKTENFGKFPTPELSILARHALRARNESLSFTKRELEVAMEVIAGQTLEGIAANLNLSENSMKFYLDNMQIKLACANQKELTEKLIRLKIWELLEREG